MHHDRLSPHYIRGFVKECRASGLNEDQTSTLLDEVLKYHLAETNEHYQAGIKAAGEHTKQANKLKTLLGMAGLGTAGAVGGGMLLNRAGEGTRGLFDQGINSNFGGGLQVGNNPNPTKGVNFHIPGEVIGGALGTGLGALSMMRKGRLGNLRKAIPFAERRIMNPATRKVTKGYGLDLAKPFRNGKDTAIAAGYLGAGAAGGALAPGFNRKIEGWVDKAHTNSLEAAKKFLESNGMSVGQGGDGGMPTAPWYADKKTTAGGGGTDYSGQIENLGLLPQEVQRAARGTSGSSKTVGAGPNWSIDQAGKQITQLDQQLAEQQTIASDPNQSPMARAQAMQATRQIEAQRNNAIQQARKAQTQMEYDQKNMERQRLEARAQAAARGEFLGGEAERLKGGPEAMRSRGATINPFTWFGRGEAPSAGEVRRLQGSNAEEQLRNQEHQWQLENMQMPQLITPESQQIITQHGI